MEGPNRSKEYIYDVSTYSDPELYEILDITSPTDRELEAKILFLIHKYDNLQNESGNQLSQFFNDIYNRFFDLSDEDDDPDGEDGFKNIFSTPVIEGNENMTGSDKATNNAPTTTPINNSSKNAEVGYTKSLEYSQDKLNPLLQQTTKRIISIDSQYRDNKKNLSSNFTMQLSEPLKDVVSMKLYSIQIPYTWYTINTDYGSNIFYLKGNVPGINNGSHDYLIDISAGNYDPANLVLTINSSVSQLKENNKDVNFGSTGISYNSFNSRMTTKIDINKQFNETGYQIIFPDISSASPFDTVELRTGSTVSIAEILGFANKVYTPYQLNSMATLPLLKDSVIDDANIRNYYLTTKNNYFTVYKYIGQDEFTDPLTANIDISFNVRFSLVTGQNYTRNELVNDISNQIAINQYLDPKYSYLQRFDISATTLDVSMVGYKTNSFYKLAIKLNRKTTNNTPYSKAHVLFSNDPSYTGIWYGANSCFQYYDMSGEVNNIISNTSPIKQNQNTFIITTNPYIELNCIKPGFDLSINNYKISLENSSDLGYLLYEYLASVNTGIVNTSKSSNGELNSDYSTAFLDNSGAFNLNIDLTNQVTQTSYRMDISGWTDNSGNYFKQNTSNYSRVGLFEDFEVTLPSDIMFLDVSNTIVFTFKFQSNYRFETPYLAIFQTSGNSKSKTTNYVKYKISAPDSALSYNLSELSALITSKFRDFKDADGKNVFSGTTFTTSNPINGRVTGTLTININKIITQNDYSIQFFDLSYVTQNQFYMDLSGYVDNSNNFISDSVVSSNQSILSGNLINSNIGFLSTCLGLSGNLGYNVSGGIYDMSKSSVFSSTVNLSNIRSVFNSVNSSYNTKYLAYFNKKTTASYNLGKSIEQDTYNPYNYWVASPDTTPYSDVSYVLVSNIESQINQQFSSIYDLSGTKISMLLNSLTSKVTCTLTVNINQPYNVYFENSSWYKNLNIDKSMIQTSYILYDNSATSLINNTVISYSSDSAISIRGYISIPQTQFYLDSTNNYFKITPFEDGLSCAYETDATLRNYNTITIAVPYDNTNGKIMYSRDSLITAINNQFIGTDASGSLIKVEVDKYGVEYTKIRLLINKQYGAKDYRVVFYDPYSFVKCFTNTSSVRNTTWDSTLGWVLGYRESTEYILTNLATGLNSTQIVGDTGVSTNLFNYFLICLDDFNQNHLNDGLVTITPRETTTQLPSYANKTNFICDPITGQRAYNSSTRTDYKKLTQNQIYAITEIANSGNSTTSVLSNSVSTKSYSQGPYVQDLFAIVPLRLAGLSNGSYYVDNGGSLQNQQRIYFGPVNLHKLSVKLVDDRGNIVNLNNANWSFSILCETLYKPKPSAGT